MRMNKETVYFQSQGYQDENISLQTVPSLARQQGYWFPDSRDTGSQLGTTLLTKKHSVTGISVPQVVSQYLLLHRLAV